MERVLLAESLPKTLSIFDKRIPPSSSGSINRWTTSIVRDVWSRKLRERTVGLLTERVQNLRLDGLLTLIAITHGILGGLMNLKRYPEQMREIVRKFDAKKATDCWNKLSDLRHTLIQYLLQQNHLEQERMRRLRGRKT